MNSLRSDTLTMRVTGVRITVFCSAIVIDVIVHCHTAGAFFESNGRKQLSLSSCGWVLILSGQFIITHGVEAAADLALTSSFDWSIKLWMVKQYQSLVLSTDMFESGDGENAFVHGLGGPAVGMFVSVEQTKWGPAFIQTRLRHDSATIRSAWVSAPPWRRRRPDGWTSTLTACRGAIAETTPDKPARKCAILCCVSCVSAWSCA